jgi:hypothetical protein
MRPCASRSQFVHLSLRDAEDVLAVDVSCEAFAVLGSFALFSLDEDFFDFAPLECCEAPA